MKCSICGNEISDNFGNNPWPVRINEEDRCCDRCNSTFIIPARLMLGRVEKENREEVIQKLNEMSYKELYALL